MILIVSLAVIGFGARENTREKKMKKAKATLTERATFSAIFCLISFRKTHSGALRFGSRRGKSKAIFPSLIVT